jgi:microcystin-dependent protein
MPPIGTIVAFAGPVNAAWETANGWMLCDGRALDRTVALNGPLFNAIGSSWGGDGVNSFNLPDLRGQFLRGVDGGTGRDPDVTSRTASQPGGHDKGLVGSIQPDQFDQHSHGISDPGHAHSFTIFDNNHSGNGNPGQDFPNNGKQTGTSVSTTGITVGATGGGETRPKNAYVYWIIRFQ